MDAYICVYLGSLIAALVITPSVIWLAGQIGAVDRPGVRTIHDRPVPGIGGVVIFLSTLSWIIFALFLDNDIKDAFLTLRVPFVTVLSAAALVFGIGLVDDLRELSARTKFLVELLAALLVCLVGVRVSRIALTNEWTLSLGGWGYVLTILWIVGITNAVNLSDGVDGLAAGIGAISCGVIALLALCSGTLTAGVCMLALLGSLCGFLVFNFHPAKIFMGDCGSLFVGFMIAVSSVMCAARSEAWTDLAVPALTLVIPIFDTLFSILRRFLERRSPFAPDRGHFHHRLLERGWGQRRVAVLICLATAVAAGLGLLLTIGHDLVALAGYAIVLCLLVLRFRSVGAIRLRETLDRLQSRCRDSRRARQDHRTFEHLQLQFRQIHDPSEWWQAVCEAACQMECAWVSLRMTGANGGVEEESWRPPQPRPDPPALIINVPLRDATHGPAVNLELGMAKNGSLEVAARRVTLLARLLDENKTTAARSPARTESPEAKSCP